MISPSFNKKLTILLLILITTFTISACELGEEEEERFYLDLNVDNHYGIETLEPGVGRYIYDEDSVVDIELEPAAGYEFLGWQGEDGEDVADVNDTEFSITMDEDKSIKAGLELVEFKPNWINFDRLDEIAYDERAEIENVPHNLQYVEFEFNNAVSEANDLEVEIANDSGNNDEDEEIIETDNITIADNEIIIDLVDWRGRFFVDEDEEDHLEFAEEYEMTVENTTEDRIFDVNNEEIPQEKLDIDFVVEEPYPAIPTNVNLKAEDDYVELSWHRSRANAKIDVDEYVENYVIYKNIDDDDFEDQEELEEIEFAADENKQVLRFEDEDVNLDENTYYYRVKAVNEYDNESKMSETVSTD